MKRFLLWSFDRGSLQYDVMCGAILAFIFLTPPGFFDDQPEFMRIPGDEGVHETIDKHGNTILTVKLDTPYFFDGDAARQTACKSIEEWLGRPVTTSRMQPIPDWTGRLIAYAVWIER